MPTQTINFANVSSASYNGTSLTEIKLNSTPIWQSKFSATMTVGSASYQQCGVKDCTWETIYGFGGTAPDSPMWQDPQTLYYYTYTQTALFALPFLANIGSMTSTSGGAIANTPIKGIFWADPNNNGGRLALWLDADFFAYKKDPVYHNPQYLFSDQETNYIQAGSLQTLKIGNRSFDLSNIDTATTATYGTYTPANDGSNRDYFTKYEPAPDITYIEWYTGSSGNPFPSAGNTVTIEVT